MENAILQQAVDRAVAIGPAVLMQGMHLRRPSDVVRARSLSQDDKRAILAAWASDFYAVDSKPALRKLPGTDEPCQSMKSRQRLENLIDRGGSSGPGAAGWIIKDVSVGAIVYQIDGTK